MKRRTLPDVPTVIGEDGGVELDGQVAGDTLLVDRDDLPRAIGWELKPQGLCRGEVCIPLRDGLVVRGELVDLAAVAGVLDRPFVLDRPTEVAVVGASVAERRDERTGLRVRDFTLPTIDGGKLTWSRIGRKKKLLFAWASW